jgi:hypothetical protein
MSLYVSDIFRIFTNYEPSRSKLWEIVRTYNYLDIAKLLFILENVHTVRARPDLALNSDQIDIFYGPHNEEVVRNTLCSHQSELVLPLCLEPTLRFERVHTDYEELVIVTANSSVVPMDVDNNTAPVASQQQIIHWQTTSDYTWHHPLDQHIDQILNLIRCTQTVTFEHNMYTAMVMHNLATKYYTQFVQHVENMLLPENLHLNRNDAVDGTATLASQRSVTVRFMQFYAMLHNAQVLNLDGRSLRSVIVPRPKRFQLYDQLHAYMNVDQQEIVCQPLLQGFHVVVSSNGGETRCYNRYGELLLGIGYNLSIPINCTFEAIMLPVNRNGEARSWRYWSSRHSYVIYIIDVFRYNDVVLLKRPLKIRLTYIAHIISGIDKHLDKLHAQYILELAKSTSSSSKQPTSSHEILGSPPSKRPRYEHSDFWQQIEVSDTEDVIDDNDNTRLKEMETEQHTSRSSSISVDSGVHGLDPLTKPKQSVKIRKMGKAKQKTDHEIYIRRLQRQLEHGRHARKVIRMLPTSLSTWSEIHNRYETNIDIYDPVVGVVVRRASDVALGSYSFKFNILYLFNLMVNNVERVGHSNICTSKEPASSSPPPQQQPNTTTTPPNISIRNQMINFEMVDFMSTVIVYADCEKYLYLCDYDRMLHQFVHRAKLSRLPYDMLGASPAISYRSEPMYVVNNQAPQQLSHGFAYMRLYYNINYQIIGYEFKLTDSRYKLPLCIPPRLLVAAVQPITT